MKKKGIGLGLFLIFIGAVAFLIQAGFIDRKIIYFVINHSTIVLSMLLVLIGINLVFRKNYFVRVITWVGFVIMLIAFGNYYKEDMPTENYVIKEKIFIEEKHEDTRKGELDLNLNALEFELGSTDKNLYESKSIGLDINHKVEYKDKDKEKADIEFNARNQSTIINILSIFLEEGISMENKGELNLNDEVIWDMELELNAVEARVDMSGLKIDGLDINGKAGNFELVFGDKYEHTKVDIDANASEVKISVPQGLGIKIKIDGKLSPNDFDGLGIKKHDDYYITENYEDAESKIDMNIDIRAGALKIVGVE